MSASKKSGQKNTKKKSVSRKLLALPGVKPPPEVKIPSPPEGFTAPNSADYRGYRPKLGELAYTTDAILELGRFRDYQSVFGITAPAAVHVANALDIANRWSRLLATTEAWATYVRASEGMTWKDALGLMDSLKGPFALAAARDTTLPERYPAIARLLAAQGVIAKRASASRKRKAAEGAAKAGATTGATAAQPSAAPTTTTQAASTSPIVAVNVPMTNGRTSGALN